MKKDRILLDGTTAPEFVNRVDLIVRTKCPSKYKLVDLETGEEYIGQCITEYDTNYWKRI
jgi:hypothetical protein|tara:strand:- start:257 stop:436 length:180 start_codon:yes stop_codon:yes gene_type:complete